MLHEGRPIAEAVLLSHDEQRERLRVGCPEAVPRSVVVGDPCVDQLRASSAFRETYRQALGVGPEQRLVVVSSTWGQDSLLGSRSANSLARIVAELPLDRYRVLAAVHPNAWYGHGGYQTHTWLAPLIDSGMILPRPEKDSWKAALVAADHVVGDNGSLTFYAVALGVPTLLDSFADGVVAPDSPMYGLGEVLPRLHPHRPLPEQLGAAAAAQRDDPGLAALADCLTSRPGECTALLRRVFYETLDLSEPEDAAVTRVVPVPEPTRARPALPLAPPSYVTVTADAAGALAVRRYPAALRRHSPVGLGDFHLAADAAEPDRRWAEAEVRLVPLPRSGTEPTGPPAAAALTALEQPDGGVLALLDDGTRLRARWAVRPPWATYALAAAVVYARHYAQAADPPPGTVHHTVTLGGDPATAATATLTVTTAEAPGAGPV